MHFLRGATQPAGGPSPGDQPVMGMHRAVIERLPLCKHNTKACEIDEAGQAAMKIWKGGSKMKLRKIFGGWLFPLQHVEL